MEMLRTATQIMDEINAVLMMNVQSEPDRKKIMALILAYCEEIKAYNVFTQANQFMNEKIESVRHKTLENLQAHKEAFILDLIEKIIEER